MCNSLAIKIKTGAEPVIESVAEGFHHIADKENMQRRYLHRTVGHAKLKEKGVRKPTLLAT